MPSEDDLHLDLVIRLLAEVIDSLAGVRPEEVRQAQSQALLEKMLQHALSMRLLYNRPLTLPLKVSGITVYDFPSAIVLSRSIFETFLTLHDVFLSPKTADDFEFTFCLWRIRGLVNLQTFDPLSIFGSTNFQWLMSELDGFKAKLQATERFMGLTPGQQKTALLKGKDDSEPPRDYAAAGFSPETFKRIYGYTSSYVHADGHAAYQIRSAKSHEAQRHMFEMALSIAMISISRAILELEQTYSECKVACAALPGAWNIARIYSDIAMKIGDPTIREQVRQQVQQHEKDI